VAKDLGLSERIAGEAKCAQVNNVLAPGHGRARDDAAEKGESAAREILNGILGAK
jgi:hypothetical protein